jgi:integrase/recombinase XerD
VGFRITKLRVPSVHESSAVVYDLSTARQPGPGAARLLEAPPADTLKGKRDRAILAKFLHHGLRCEELCGLRVRDLQSRQGVPHLRVLGKGSKGRYVPAHPQTGSMTL